MSFGWYARTNRALNVTCDDCHAKRGIPCHVPSGIGTHQSRIDKEKRSTERRVDLFKDTFASRLLRMALERGTTTLIALKKEQHRLGGAQGNIMHTLGTYVGGSRAVLKRGGKIGRTIRVLWIGSTGESFEERALNWLATLTDAQLEQAHGRVESEAIEAGRVNDEAQRAGISTEQTTDDERRALEWLRLVRYTIGTRTMRRAA